MLSTKLLKQVALNAGADIVAVGPTSRYEGCPTQMDIRYALPGCKSIIALGFKHFRGVFRGIEEGTFFTNYSSMGYASINSIRQPLTLKAICDWIEDQGYDTMPIPNHLGWTPNDLSGQVIGKEKIPRENFSKPAKEGYPHPNVAHHMRLGAVIAGLGEIGWSKMFLSKEYGPRQRIALLLTDAEFEYDPVVKPGTICDRCKLCVKNCTGNAIPFDDNDCITVTIDGHEIKWANIDYMKCSRYFCGASPKHNPFNITEEDRVNFAEHVGKAQEYKLRTSYWYARALEGASGCIRACMRHLEETGRITSRFESKFRRKPAWKLKDDTETELPNQDKEIENWE